MREDRALGIGQQGTLSGTCQRLASARTLASPSAPKPPPIREKRARRVNDDREPMAGSNPIAGQASLCRMA